MNIPRAFSPIALLFIVANPTMGEDGWAKLAGPDEPVSPFFFQIPKLSLSYGQLKHRDGGPEFREDAVVGAIGWEGIFGGMDTFAIDAEFLKTATEETQLTDTDIWRWGVTGTYLRSSWDRALRPSELTGTPRFFRAAGGVGAFFRQQVFEVDTNFGHVERTFDMAGAEARVDFEAAPRNILSPFLSLRGGGGWVGVEINGNGDDRVNTGAVLATVEGGILSQPLWHFEIRGGARYQYLKVFAEDVYSGETTEMQLIFVELRFPF